MEDVAAWLIKELRTEIEVMEEYGRAKDRWIADMRRGHHARDLLEMGLGKRDLEATATGAQNVLNEMLPHLKKMLQQAEKATANKKAPAEDANQPGPTLALITNNTHKEYSK